MNHSRLTHLESHLQCIDRIQHAIEEENSWLRAENAPVPNELLERKRALLPALDDALEFLRACNAEPAGFSSGERNLLKQARRKMMKIFYVDRENEQLLLKCSVTAQRGPAPAQSINQVLLHHAYHHGEKPSEQP